MSTDSCPVSDWATDYDIFDPEYVRNPAPVWEDLRGRCPVAHTHRHGGSWLPTRYEDLQAMVKMVPALSSRSVTVVPPPPELRDRLVTEAKQYGSESPPITSDPPEHKAFRRLILPFFSPHAVEAHIPHTRALCNGLIDGFIANGETDAASDYAQQITPRVIAHIIGIDPDRADDFVEWVRGLLELGQTQPELRIKYRGIIREFFAEMVAERRRNPKDDAISKLIAAEVDGEKLSDYTVVGICVLLLVAGIDTTWSSIGSSLWHFAGNPEDRARMYREPGAASDRRRGAAALLFAGNDGPQGDGTGAGERRGDAARRQGPAELPGRQQGSGGFRQAGRGRARQATQPPYRLRCRHPSLRGLQPRPHGDAGGAAGLVRPPARFRALRFGCRRLGRGAGAGSAGRAGALHRRLTPAAHYTLRSRGAAGTECRSETRFRSRTATRNGFPQ